MTDETIAQVVKDGLCTGCGTCVALCPNEAIKLTINEKKGIYVPELDEEKCNNCGMCYNVCPGHSVDFKQFNLEIFRKEPENVLIGNYLNCYIGHSKDYDIRYNCASGGLITQLLIFAMEEKIIDGALVTRMKKDNPLEPEPFIARTREEIIEASKSTYCPVPANVALKEILNSKQEERFAVVGLPCHIHGIRKAEQINKSLKEKIYLHIGIFCGHAPNFLGTEYLFKKNLLHKTLSLAVTFNAKKHFL
jgi:coenzyme F420 hydrogenase subunit beta